ncbi:hypothetical protein G7Y89_g12785 [Cudoniella acicularis]|uniref:Carboxylesterase type B domain-containing protein n=1 Tax=Cudoniella acicularis TaxID=354080 RepID=A0A8H4R8J3_9HELO|nr:hypothetical protein G7Y89_g12785 [Cudoniella acicularis]
MQLSSTCGNGKGFLSRSLQWEIYDGHLQRIPDLTVLQILMRRTSVPLAPKPQQQVSLYTLKLFLNSNCTEQKPLPVFVWIHRGIDSYRLNIFRFPNSAELDPSELNLGIMDQRLAYASLSPHFSALVLTLTQVLNGYEKTSQHSDGGPSKIALRGQSAGAASVDIHNYAYRSDPIASSLVADSGVASTISSSDFQRSNFSFIASQLGCTSTDASEQLACMKFVPVQNIEDFLFNRTVAGTKPAVAFAPIADGELIFTSSEYYAMAAAGNYSRLLSSPIS